MRKTLAFVALMLMSMQVAADEVGEAIDRYFVMMRTADFAAAAEIFDTEEQRKFRDSLAFLFTLPPDSQNQLLSALFGAGATADYVDQLSDGQFFASILANTMMQSGMLPLLETADMQYLGHIMEGEIAHAVTRVLIETPEYQTESMSVTSLVRRGDQWKLMMTPDIRNIPDRLRSVVGQ